MRITGLSARIAILIVLAGCGTSITPASGPSQATASLQMQTAIAPDSRERWVRNDIPPRYQWNHNWGYCGEVSMISAGLYYGQYISQYDSRAAATKAPQNEERSQLLLGVNALHAAANMHLTAETWTDPSRDNADEFLVWVKQHAVLGQPVAIGIYMNEFRFYHVRRHLAGSPQYDHIVPVVGIGSDRLGESGTFFPNDELTFSDNGEWGSLRHAQYYFTYRFKDFPKTRQEANLPHGAIYSVASRARDFGIDVTGVVDRDRETIPVRVTTNLNYEMPQIAEGSSQRPKPEPLTLTVTVSGMKAGEVYNLYRYNSLASVPDGEFNARAGQAAERWVVKAGSSGRFTQTENIMSDDEAVYRAVPQNAP